MVTTLHNVPGANTPLVDREDERAILRDLARRADLGDGQLILLGGEAGIGKTTLALAVPTLAPPGVRMLIGRSYDLMETPPYGPWRDCFRHWPEGVGIPPAPLRMQGDEPETQDALFAQVQSAVTAIARSRLLILILDDLQWADPASLDLFRHLAHDLAGRRILIIGTYRNDELTDAHPLKALLPRLMRESPTTRLTLPRLLPANVTEMVTARFGTGRQIDALSRSVYRTTAGNPLFVWEMCRALVSAHAVRRTASIRRRSLRHPRHSRSWWRRASPASIRPQNGCWKWRRLSVKPSPSRSSARSSINRKRTSWRDWSRRQRHT
jgi:hypothetical protein